MTIRGPRYDPLLSRGRGENACRSGRKAQTKKRGRVSRADLTALQSLGFLREMPVHELCHNSPWHTDSLIGVGLSLPILRVLSKAQGDEFRVTVRLPDRDDDVLPPVCHVGHRSPGGAGG